MLNTHLKPFIIGVREFPGAQDMPVSFPDPGHLLEDKENIRIIDI